MKTLLIKDLARFCQGSLDANCRSLGIETSSCKGKFDHSKIKTWEDVETHKKESVLRRLKSTTKSLLIGG